MNTCESCKSYTKEPGDNVRCNEGVVIRGCIPQPNFGCTLWKTKPVEFTGTIGKAKDYQPDAVVVCPLVGEDKGLRETFDASEGKVKVRLEYLPNPMGETSVTWGEIIGSSTPDMS